MCRAPVVSAGGGGGSSVFVSFCIFLRLVAVFYLKALELGSARCADCEDCLVTAVVRTIIAITSTVGSGAAGSTFSRKSFTTLWRSMLEMSRWTVRERVHLKWIVKIRGGVLMGPHPVVNQATREGVCRHPHPSTRPKTRSGGIKRPCRAV